MSSPSSYGSRMLFQSINDDLSASMATADVLSKEFDSLLKEASSPSPSPTSTSFSTSSNNNTTKPGPKISSSLPPVDSVSYSSKNTPTPTVLPPSPLPPRTPTTPRTASEGFTYSQRSPRQSPNTVRRQLPGQTSPRHPSPSRYDRSPRGSTSYPDRSPLPSPTVAPLDSVLRSTALHSSPNRLSPYESNTMGRRSPMLDRGPSPLSFNHPAAKTLPRSFVVKQPDEGVQHQKSPSKWNETDLDKSYERKPHHTYDKTEWLRPSVPNSSWRESNLDGPPPAPSPKKDPRSPSFQYQTGSLPRNTRIPVPPDVTSPAHSPYYPQPIISRISIPPASSETRKRKPIPLSVIMRLQNPHWRAMSRMHPKLTGGEVEMSSYQPAGHVIYTQPVFPPQQPAPELRQPTIYSDVLNPGDVDAELERLDYIYLIPAIQEDPNSSDVEQPTTPAPRPLSPTRLQPMVAPEAQIPVIPDMEELFRIREEIPRPLKKRGSVDHSQPLKSASHYQPNQYKNLIDKLFRRKERSRKGEQGSETSSSSDGEECAVPPPRVPQTSTLFPQDLRNYHSILRRSNQDRKGTGNRARLSPLVLLLDGALVGELETVQRAVQEMSDPSQPNDEGITALHNAVCGGHYKVVEFLVRIGANVSSPDSHGWTPLHCAASCNDRLLCEFLVRNGAAIMAMTESDGAIASQKCDPYAFGFDECESYLRGVEEAMGVENSGVLYALWSYPAQGPDELNFREGDMVTILQKPEGSSWWWASLYGREGLVPNNYFGLFPKVRPKTLC